MFTIYVSPANIVLNPTKAFKSSEGRKVLREFQAGALLQATTETDRVTQCWSLVHPSGRTRNFRAGSLLPGALIRFGRKIESASETAEETLSWLFDPAKLAALAGEWALAKRCVADWRRQRGEFKYGESALSELGRAALRTLKKIGFLFMHAELLPIFNELNQYGLLDVRSEGFAVLSVPGYKLKIPPGKPLQLEYLTHLTPSPRTCS